VVAEKARYESLKDIIVSIVFSLLKKVWNLNLNLSLRRAELRKASRLDVQHIVQNTALIVECKNC
jgi:hypothetical protein